MLKHVRIVLVEPAGSANVGSVSRAMANMGLAELVLVAPQCDWLDNAARSYAVRSRDILEGARVVPDVPAALAGCVSTFATSSKLGLYRRQAAITPKEAAGLALAATADGPVAIAFGPEDRGLLTRELLHFDRVITIPSDDAYPVLNLAAAVMVVCYELHLARLAASGSEPLPLAVDRGIATADQKRIMFEKLFDALDVLGFFYGPNPDHLRYALRHMLGRIDLGVNEADILIGLAKQIRWYVENHPRRVDGTGA